MKGGFAKIKSEYILSKHGSSMNFNDWWVVSIVNDSNHRNGMMTFPMTIWNYFWAISPSSKPPSSQKMVICWHFLPANLWLHSDTLLFLSFSERFDGRISWIVVGPERWCIGLLSSSDLVRLESPKSICRQMAGRSHWFLVRHGPPWSAKIGQWFRKSLGSSCWLFQKKTTSETMKIFGNQSAVSSCWCCWCIISSWGSVLLWLKPWNPRDCLWWWLEMWSSSLRKFQQFWGDVWVKMVLDTIHSWLFLDQHHGNPKNVGVCLHMNIYIWIYIYIYVCM